MWTRRVVVPIAMTNSCPECGEPMEFEQHEVRLRTGVCPACTKEFAFVEGATVSGRLGSPPAGADTSSEPDEAREPRTEVALECEECGSPLSVREGEHGALEVACAQCETMTIFVPKREPRREGPPRPRPFGSDTSRGSPCRRCGAPLRFSTGEDGLLVGECDSCGNRFTLPPRPDRGQGRPAYRGSRGFGRKAFPSRPEGDRRFSPRSEGQGRQPYSSGARRRGFRYDDNRARRKRSRRAE